MKQRDGISTPPEHHIPDFQSREELAEFWDTHSFTDYLEDLEPAEAQIAEGDATPLNVDPSYANNSSSR